MDNNTLIKNPILERLEILIKKKVGESSKIEKLGDKEMQVLTEWNEFVKIIRDDKLTLDVYTSIVGDKKDDKHADKKISTSLTHFLERKSSIFGTPGQGSSYVYGVYKPKIYSNKKDGKYIFYKGKKVGLNDEDVKFLKESYATSSSDTAKEENGKLVLNRKAYMSKIEAEQYFKENIFELFNAIVKQNKNEFKDTEGKDKKILELFYKYGAKQTLYKMYVLKSYSDEGGTGLICSYDEKMYELYKMIKNGESIDSYDINKNESDENCLVFKRNLNELGLFWLEGSHIIKEGKNKYKIKGDTKEYNSKDEALKVLKNNQDKDKDKVIPIKLKINETILNYFYECIGMKIKKETTKIISDVLVNYYYLQSMFDDIRENQNIIYYGPPGTGKTYNVRRFLDFNCVNNQYKIIQCHANFTYDEFIEGFKPVGITSNGQLKLQIVNGVFKEFCIEAKKDLNNDYYFICDEINRANVSQMFGECLSLIETDYRDYFIDNNGNEKRDNLLSTPMSQTITNMILEKAKGKNNSINEEKLKASYEEYKSLIYELIVNFKDSKDSNDIKSCTYEEWQKQKNTIIDSIEVKFGIPRNIHFIGMMNDVDKSIDSFDLALRRRFAWILKTYDKTVLKNYLIEKGYVEENVDDYVNKCTDINNNLAKDYGKSYQLGHSYFMKIDNYIESNNGDKEINDESKKLLFAKHIQPLLTEYLRSFESENDIDNKIEDLKKKFGISDSDEDKHGNTNVKDANNDNVAQEVVS